MDQSQWLKGALDLAVVAAIGNGASYGYAIVQTLEAAGLSGVADASVYGTLKRLEVSGVLESELVASGEGPARRYYRRTAAGDAWFRSSVRTWRRLSNALEGLLGESR